MTPRHSLSTLLAAPLTAAGLALCFAPAALASPRAAKVPEPGQMAPDFTLKDLDGKAHRLSSLKGKTVVLEWYNPDCPFVVYAHDDGGPLRGLAKKHTAKGDIVWLAINSGAPGKQGHGIERNRKSKAEYDLDHAILVDEDGKVGRAYGATNTPQVVIVDPKGRVAYYGAIDNAPFGRDDDGPRVDYVSKALGDMAAGRPVATPRTTPYGCSVKYAK